MTTEIATTHTDPAEDVAPEPALTHRSRGGATGPGWEEVCALTDLPVERGVAALVAGHQVALFRTHEDRVHAVQQYDPYCGANVIARGIVGSRGGVPTVASPMYRQVFDLRTGACLDAVGREPIALLIWSVRVVDGAVLVAREPVREGPAA